MQNSEDRISANKVITEAEPENIIRIGNVSSSKKNENK
jgi:hypothetical protein